MLFLFIQIHKLSSKARLQKYASIVVYGAFPDNSLRIIMRNILLNRSLSLVDKLACLYFYVASFRTLLFVGTKLWFAGVKLSFARAKLSFGGSKPSACEASAARVWPGGEDCVPLQRFI